MRTRALPLAMLAVSLLAACSDSHITSTRQTPAPPPAPRQSYIQLSGTLDQNITALITNLFPQGLEDAAGDRWDGVKTKYAAGLTDPSQMKVARSMVVNLVNWVKQKMPQMSASAIAPESVNSAATRLSEYMAMYVYLGPDQPVPPYFPGEDATFGIVTPTTATTIVTPSTEAGVALDAGSVLETTIITISQNPNAYPDNCSGPLHTPYCQYPQFYFFDQFPHVPFQKPVHVAVCHVDVATSMRAPLVGEGTNHGNFRFAHPTPSALVNGGTVVGDIEVLPLVTQSFTNCPGNGGTTYTLPTAGGFGLMERARDALHELALATGRMISPRAALAIDQGGGGDVLTFSPINVVDTTSRPDATVLSAAAAPASNYLGVPTTVSVTYSVTDSGNASVIDDSVTIYIAGDPSLTKGATALSSATALDTIPPLQSRTYTTQVAIPVTLAAGTYYVGPRITAGALPDRNLANNTAAATYTILPPPPPVISFTATQQYTTTDANGVISYWDRYPIPVTNTSQYGDILFAPSPDLPPCGNNTSASRSWVDVFGDGRTIYGFCGFAQASDLASIWFAVPAGAQPPADVSITLTDRRTSGVYASNHLTLYGAVYDFYPRTPNVTWPAVTGATSYTLAVEYCPYPLWTEPDYTTTCTSWVPNGTQYGLTATNAHFDPQFVGAQPGRWRVGAEGIAAGTAWGPWHYFRFTK